MEIIIKESTIVRPAEDTPKRRLWNSCLDLMMNTRNHIRTVYYFKPDGSSDFFETGRLKEALSKVLVPFYPAAGRLGFDEDGRLEIICNGEGALFVEAKSGSAMDYFIGNFSDDSQVRLVPKVDYSGGISSFPLLALQVTKFKCGGVCLGVGFQHTLGDGFTALHIINSWADTTARGYSSTAIAPFIDRTPLRARDPPMPKFHHVEYDAPPPEPQSDDLNSFTISTFKLTHDQLTTLKSKANPTNSSGTKYSTYNTLTAHIWRCLSKAKGLSGDQATKLYITINGRSRLNPPLPQSYFGNVNFIAALTARAGDLETESFIDTAKRINERLKEINDEYLRSALDYIEKMPDLSTSVRGPQTFVSRNLAITSWMWLPIYDADFGWGRPIYMGPANVVYEGKFYVIQSPDNDGSLPLLTRLETSHMKLFQKFLYQI